MQLELQNVRTTREGRVVATLIAVAYGFTVEVSCWAELLTQWGASLTRAFLLKEAVQAARAKVAEAQAGDRYASDPGYAAVLDQFATEMEAEIPLRVDAFYTALKAKHVAEGNAAAAAAVQEEWDAWHAARVDVSELAGAV